MFTKSQTEIMLDAEIQSALKKLAETDKKSEEYGKLVEHITKLHKLTTEQRSKPVSKDTVLVVCANIFGVLWLARYERDNVIKAKEAMKNVIKPR